MNRSRPRCRAARLKAHEGIQANLEEPQRKLEFRESIKADRIIGVLEADGGSIPWQGLVATRSLDIPQLKTFRTTAKVRFASIGAPRLTIRSRAATTSRRVIDPASPFQVGDRVAFGVSHPCTTFDKWDLISLDDDDYNVVSAIKTYF